MDGGVGADRSMAGIRHRPTLVAAVIAVSSLLLDDTDRVMARGVLFAVAAGAGAHNLWQHRRRAALADFWVLVGCCALFALSNIVRAVAPDAAAGELLNAVAAVLLLLASVLFVRRMRPGAGFEIVVDGLIVGIVSSLAVRELSLLTSVGTTLDGGAAVLMIVGLVGVSVWLRALLSTRSVPIRAFALAAGLAIVANVVVVMGGMGPVRPAWVDAFTLASTVVLVFALTHPTIAERTVAIPQPGRLSAGGVLLLALGLGAAPAVIGVRIITGTPPDLLVGAGLTALAGLWAVRAANALNARHHHNRLLDAQLGTDPLTGVASRRRFMEHLDEVIAQRRFDTAVLFIDLDGFKLVNDRHGHAVGDALLVAVAHRIAEVLTDVDPDGIVARLSGDEFAVATTAQPDTVRHLLDRAVAEPATLPSGLRIRARMSVGIAHLRDGDAGATTVLDRADHDMYRSKRGRSDRSVDLRRLEDDRAGSAGSDEVTG